MRHPCKVFLAGSIPAPSTKLRGMLNTCMTTASTKISTDYDGKPRILFQGECQNPECPNMFWVPKHVLKRRRYCCRECQSTVRKSTRVEMECRRCGVSFFKRPSSFDKSRHRAFF